MINLAHKRVAIIGLGKLTGVASARALYEMGAKVTVSDIKGKEELKEEIEILKDIEVNYDLNGHGKKSLNNDLIIVSPGVPLDIDFFKEAKRLDIPVISEVELAYQLTEAHIIGITGTNGKTTTTSMLGEILKEGLKHRVRVAGNIGKPLIQQIKGLRKEDWLVTELSSFQLETIDKFNSDIALYLNFSPDHLDRHKSIENYWKAKKRIFENQGPEDVSLINADDLEVIRAANDIKSKKYELSLKKEIEKGVFLYKDSLYFKDKKNTECILDIDDIPLFGMHNVQNTAFAIAVARMLGVNKKIIQERIMNFHPSAHRMEDIGENIEELSFIDDSKATNPNAAINALEAIETPIILIAGGQDRDADFKLFAETINKNVKKLILLGETDDKLEKSVLKKGFKNIYKVQDMEAAVREGLKDINPGDCLLLSPGCPSWDMYSSYKERGKDFRKSLNTLIPRIKV